MTYSINNLKKGQSCFYRTKAKCGGPSFKPSNTTGVEIEYIEFRTSDIVNMDPGNNFLESNVNLTAKRLSPPLTGMPKRW